MSLAGTLSGLTAGVKLAAGRDSAHNRGGYRLLIPVKAWWYSAFQRGEIRTLMITRSHLASARGKYLCLLTALATLAFTASPAVAEPRPAGPPQLEGSLLTGAVYDGSGLPLIGALIAVAIPGNEHPTALTASDHSGHFAVSLNPGVYTLVARSFGHISAVIPGVQMPRATPVRLQLRSERQVVSLLSDNAPLDIGYAFRPSVRDVLRGTESTLDAGGVTETDAAWINSFGEGSQWANVGGEFSLWAVAPTGGGTIDDSRSATEFSMGSIGVGRQDWLFRGQLAAGGVVRARSDVSRVLSDVHALRLGIGFAGKDLAGPDLDHAPRSMWVGSLSAEDLWRLGDAVQVGYGVRFEHYNYLEETGLISPRVQVAFMPVESVTLTTAVSYDAEAPGLAELRFQVDPLAVRYMDVIGVDNIQPERTLRYEFGLQTATANTEWRARAYHDQITDELVGVYLANDQGSSDYLVANLGDSVMQGLEFDVRRSFMDSVAGVFSYAYGRREGAALPTGLATERGLLAADFDAGSAAVDIVHELAAGVETVVGAYDTRLNATYRWQTGIPVLRDGNLESIYERLDLRVRQPLPLRMFSSDWSALMQVQNVLGTSYDGVFDFRLGDAPVLARLFSGGLAVRF